MSPANSGPGEQAKARARARQPPKACRGCSGLQPGSGLMDVEDMGNLGLERLRRKANIAQQMLTDVMEQLTKLQPSHRHPTESKQKFNSLRGFNRRSINFCFFNSSSVSC
ncbi:uncharacterized protein LOC108650322 [Drosophila navojoa]|uniref:uncharacterized protein LOC108650322 n=1 Tax=Drosophila navojoa TaxID=7232 RepID=UPI00084638E1|nr:uncharacterized protein LOC108650322 [Drosophila navojoa]